MRPDVRASYFRTRFCDQKLGHIFGPETGVKTRPLGQPRCLLGLPRAGWSGLPRASATGREVIARTRRNIIAALCWRTTVLHCCYRVLIIYMNFPSQGVVGSAVVGNRTYGSVCISLFSSSDIDMLW